MATSASGTYTVEASVKLEVDLPHSREYTDETNARLDEQLVETIEAAQEAGNDHLAELLSYELGSHYYRTR